MKVSLIQMCSTDDRADNLDTAESLCREAAPAADLVALPENFLYLRSEGLTIPDPVDLDGPEVERFASIAREGSAWILLGSLPERVGHGDDRVFNTSVLLDRSGRIQAVYRKIHLFDVSIPGGPQLRESDAVAPGDRVVVVDTEFGPAGLSICYDLRFPELYRRLAGAGARILFAPSAFTDRTGPDHWHLLVRARAVENQCFLIAPAQWGRHSDRRASYGHSLVVDPWGRIVAEKAGGTGILSATVDLEEVDKVRNSIPAGRHTRSWLQPPKDQS